MTSRRFETVGVMHTSNEVTWTFGLLDTIPEVEISAVNDFPGVEIDANRRSRSAAPSDTAGERRAAPTIWERLLHTAWGLS